MRTIILPLLFTGLCFIASAENRVAVPQPTCLGCRIDSTNLTVVQPSTNLCPNEVRLISSDGVINEIQAFYPKAATFEDIAAQINSRYGNFAMPGLQEGAVWMWRVTPERFAIQLSRHEEGPLLIYVAFEASPTNATH